MILPVRGTVAARGQKNEGKAARGVRISNFRASLGPPFKNASKSQMFDFGGFAKSKIWVNVDRSYPREIDGRFSDHVFVRFLGQTSCLRSTPVAIKDARAQFMSKFRIISSTGVERRQLVG